MEEEYKKFQEMGKTAFVLGYTGETGKALVQELVNSSIFHKVILFGRRVVPFPEEDQYKCLEQKSIDYDNLDAHKDEFTGCDVGYCCLGTTRSKHGKEVFYKVDHDYVVNSAKVAKETGCKQFHLVSSQGANQNSWFYYPKVKGEVEEELKAMDFERLNIYHPALLMCDRTEHRFTEKIAQTLVKPVMWLSPTAITTPTTVLGKAMVNATVSEGDGRVNVLENRQIFKVAGELKEKNSGKNENKTDTKL